MSFKAISIDGLSIKKADFEAFKQDFENLCKTYPFDNDEKPSIEIALNDINMNNYRELQTFSPFGVGFKEPLFKVSGLPTRGLQFISYGKHLSTPLSIQSKLLGFNMAEETIKRTAYIDIFGTFYLNTKFKTTLEFRISDFIAK